MRAAHLAPLPRSVREGVNEVGDGEGDGEGDDALDGVGDGVGDGSGVDELDGVGDGEGEGIGDGAGGGVGDGVAVLRSIVKVRFAGGAVEAIASRAASFCVPGATL